MHSQGEVYKVYMVPARRYSAPTQQLRGNQVVWTNGKQIILDVLDAVLLKYSIYRKQY